MWAAVALSFGLAMDATAVSAARGLRATRRELFVVPLLFGLFQSGMSTLGWVGGRFAGEYIARYQHWVAFGLLAAIGIKMIVDAVRTGAEDEPPPGTMSLYLALAVATSIDAAAAGLTLPLVPVAPWIALVLIGTITLACSVAGYAAGRLLGHALGARLGVLGGLVLIAIGTNMLIHGL